MKQVLVNRKRRCPPESPPRVARTAVTARIRSKPTAEGQQYLEQYVLRRDRARWSRMKHQSEQIIQDIDRALAKLELPRDLTAEDRAVRAPVAASVNSRSRAKKICST